ncbi:MAG TPA: response regulator [Tepidisphaeraceae bacterium]|jgi:DNA-binding NarL/FixJ family response regulator
MPASSSRSRQRLIILCTELATIRAITDTLSGHFEIIWSRGMQGLALLAAQQEVPPVAVLVDHSFPHGSAIEALESVRQAHPSVRRILITDHCDLGLIIRGLHTGAVERIVYKPIHPPELLLAIGIQNLPASAIAAHVQRTPGAAQSGTAG